MLRLLGKSRKFKQRSFCFGSAAGIHPLPKPHSQPLANSHKKSLPKEAPFFYFFLGPFGFLGSELGSNLDCLGVTASLDASVELLQGFGNRSVTSSFVGFHVGFPGDLASCLLQTHSAISQLLDSSLHGFGSFRLGFVSFVSHVGTITHPDPESNTNLPKNTISHKKSPSTPSTLSYPRESSSWLLQPNTRRSLLPSSRHRAQKVFSSPGGGTFSGQPIISLLTSETLSKSTQTTPIRTPKLPLLTAKGLFLPSFLQKRIPTMLQMIQSIGLMQSWKVAFSTADQVADFLRYPNMVIPSLNPDHWELHQANIGRQEDGTLAGIVVFSRKDVVLETDSDVVDLMES